MPIVVDRHRRHPHFTAPGTHSAERIVLALQQWTAETGAPPRSYDWCPSSGRSLGHIGPEPTKWELEHPRWPGSTTVYRYFGSWPQALHAAGLPARTKRQTMPLGDRVAAAKRLSAEGQSAAEIADLLEVSVGTVYRYLKAHPCRQCAAPVVGTGPICQACSTRASNPQRWTSEQFLERAHAWKARTGRFPTQVDWTPRAAGADGQPNLWEREYPDWPPASAARYLFGSWKEVRLALDLAPYNPPWEPEAQLEAIRAWNERTGRPPRKHEWETTDGSHPSSATVRRTFGSFGGALERAGFSKATAPQRTDAELVELARAWRRQHGRWPSTSDWKRATGATPAAAVVIRRFGGWRAFLAAAAS